MSFINDISFEDLQRLRKVVRKVWMAYHPPHLQTDKEADKLIESFGPVVQQRIIKRIIDHNIV